MNTFSKLTFAISPCALVLATCAAAQTGDNDEPAPANADFQIEVMGEFDRPWAIEFLPGSDTLVITETPGTLKFMDTATGEVIPVGGVPEVAYGGQGGLGDVAFLESEADRTDGRTIFLSWAELSEDGDTRGAVVGRGTLNCLTDTCSIEGLNVIWRQTPKVEGRGHFSHRIAISPDEQYLFIASGERQKMEPAQDLSNTLGSIVRLNLDGTPAAGNPFAEQGAEQGAEQAGEQAGEQGGVTAEIWSYGHRNILGMDWDAQGRLWEVEHGPAGGDELNLVRRAANYGWPIVSDGEHYNGDPIPDHATRPEFQTAAMGWTPVIAPGDMIIYSGDMFGPWRGNALIAGLSSKALVRVEIDGETAREVARYEIGGRLRSIEQGPDGAIWIAEDGEKGRVFKITM